MIIEEARRQGVEGIVVTHAMLAPTRMTIPVMRRAAEAGAFVEFSYNGLVGRNKLPEASDYARRSEKWPAILHPVERLGTA